MKTLGLSWMGVRTKEFAAMVKLFRDALGLELTHAEEEFVVLRTGDGDTVEVFGPNWKYNRHFSPAPVVGFLVDDMDEARARLRKARFRTTWYQSASRCVTKPALRYIESGPGMLQAADSGFLTG